MKILTGAHPSANPMTTKENLSPPSAGNRLGLKKASLISLMCACLLVSFSASQAADAPAVKFGAETRSTNAVYEINGDAISGEYTHVLRGKHSVLLEISDTGVIAVKQAAGTATTMMINFADVSKSMRDSPYSAEDFVEARTLRNDLQGKTISLMDAYQKGVGCQSELDDMINAADAMMDACVLDMDPLGCALAANSYIKARNAYPECQ